MEVLGTKGGHGKDFTAMCNGIGAELGLPPVVIRRRKGDPKNLPICSAWPHNVRPKGYYGDLWAEITGPTEEGEDLVERILALIGTLNETDQLRLGADPMVDAIVTASRALAEQQGKPLVEATANGAEPEPIELDQRIRAAMEAAGWSQAKLAKAAGTSQSTISKILNSKPGPSPATINSVAKVLGLKEPWL
jgi:DNA-binding XRE family transcriptional regulator